MIKFELSEYETRLISEALKETREQVTSLRRHHHVKGGSASLVVCESLDSKIKELNKLIRTFESLRSFNSLEEFVVSADLPHRVLNAIRSHYVAKGKDLMDLVKDIKSGEIAEIRNIGEKSFKVLEDYAEKLEPEEEEQDGNAK